MTERDDDLGVIGRFINGELAESGAFDDFPKAPEKPQEKKEEPSIPAPETQSDPNLYRIEVPGASFSLRIHHIGDELPATLSFTSVEQAYTHPDLRRTVRDVMKATYPNAYEYARFSAVGIRNKTQEQFDLSDAWRKDDYIEFLEEGDVDTLMYTATLPTFIGQVVGRSTTFSYRFSRDSRTNQYNEGISLSQGLSKNFPESLAGYLLTRNEDYNRMLVKDPDAHAEMLANQVQAIAHVRFPNPLNPF